MASGYQQGFWGPEPAAAFAWAFTPELPVDLVGTHIVNVGAVGPSRACCA